MTYANGTEALNYDLKTSTTVSAAGYILTNDSTNNTLDLAATTEIGLCISADESSRDAAGDLETASATVAAYPFGGVLLVATVASETWTTGLPVYAANSGLATISSGSSAKKIGLYVGSGVATSSSAGETLIEVATAGAEIA